MMTQKNRLSNPFCKCAGNLGAVSAILQAARKEGYVDPWNYWGGPKNQCNINGVKQPPQTEGVK